MGAVFGRFEMSASLHRGDCLAALCRTNAAHARAVMSMQLQAAITCSVCNDQTTKTMPTETYRDHTARDGDE
jgi:hypothetical protein